MLHFLGLIYFVISLFLDFHRFHLIFAFCVMRENPRLIAENNELHAMLIAESDRSDVTTGTTALKRL